MTVHVWCPICQQYGVEHDHWPGMRHPELPTTGGMIPSEKLTPGDKVANAIKKISQ